MKKRILSMVLTLCMLLSLLPTVALADGTGSFTVTGDDLNGVSYAGGVLTISSAAPVTIAQTAGVATSTTDRIEVTSAANITLAGVNIDVSNSNAAAFNITDTAGAVTVTLADGSENTLKSGKKQAGLHVPNNAAVTIEGTGMLSAYGKGPGDGTAGAGIGGNPNEKSGVITINSGIVNAYGSEQSSGISGGAWGAGNAVTIKGGTVNAVATGWGGSGIGRGYSGSGSGEVTITGGTVNAIGKGGYGAIQLSPKNSSNTAVQLYTLTVNDTSGSPLANAAVTALSTTPELGYTYGMADVKTDTAGKLYVYLPANKTAVSVTVVGKTYSGSVTSNAATLTIPQQAKWGVAGTDNAAPTAWVGSGTLTDAVDYANNKDNNGIQSGTAYIQLQSNVDTTATLDFAKGKTTVLDLNGKTIDRGLTAATSSGNVLNVQGTLTLRDTSASAATAPGKITGGNNNGSCGGVFVGGTFNMEGGSITGNSATDGGGVFVAGSFTMTGGSVTGNSCNKYYSGGGVYVYSGGSLTVGGTANVSDNKQGTGTSAPANNIFLTYDSNNTKTITIAVSGATALAEGAAFGITTQTAPTTDAPVAITGTNSANVSKYFASDNSAYAVQNRGSGNAQVLQLVLAHNHCVCGGTTDMGDHKDHSTKLTYTPVNGTAQFPGTDYTIDSYPDKSWKLTAGSYYLAEDVTLNKQLYVAAGDTVNLCLNGYALVQAASTAAIYVDGGGTLNLCDCKTSSTSGKITRSQGACIFITQNGSCTMYGGSIAGNYGGGVGVSGGSFTLNGGSITGNESGVGLGGAASSFTMNGGSITGNSSEYQGGGIQITGGSFTMNGGSITGNSSLLAGGGVFLTNTGSFTVGGTAKIENNTSGTGTSKVTDNVYLSDGKTLTVSTAKALANGAKIGITTETAPTAEAPVAITGNNSDNYSTYFSSDNSSYSIKNGANNVVQLVKKPDITKTAAINGSFTVKVGTNEVTSAAAGETVTVTATPSSGYEMDKITVTKTGDTSTAVTVTNGSFTMPAYPVTVTVSFKTSGGNPTTSALTVTVNDNSGNPVPDATVTITDGSGKTITLIYDSTSKKYKADTVTDGKYTLVVKKGDIEITTALDVKPSMSMPTITLPTGKQNTVVETKPNTPPTFADMNDLFTKPVVSDSTKGITQDDKDKIIGGGTVEIKLVSEQKAESATGGDASLIKTAGGADRTYLFVDLSVFKTVTPSSGSATNTKLSELNGLIDIVLEVPQNMRSAGLKIFRVHNNVAEELTRTANSDGELFTYTAGEQYATLTVKKFSTYSFAMTGYTVTINGGGTGASGSDNYAQGVTVPINAGTKSGYSFGGWTTSDGVTFANASSATTTFTMPAKAVTVTANWTYNGGSSGGGGGGGGSSYNYYTITATAGVGGAISTGEKVSVREGDSAGFTFTPNKGYAIADVLVNGKSVGAVKTYTFPNVRSNQTIHVTFKASNGHVNPQTGVAFEDVQDNDWFADSVYVAVQNGWFAGTSQTTFSPDGNTTRGMIATVLWRMEKQPSASAASLFEDVASGAYYADGVHWAQEYNVVKGYGNGKFGPMDHITREQMAAILYRYAQFKGYDVSKTSALDRFTDGGTTSEYAKASMAWAVANGLLSGKGNGILDPKSGATRAEVATILTRFADLFSQK